MAFNVDDMLGVISGLGGLTKSSKFLVRIIPPRSLFGLGGRYLEFLCDSTNLPGLSWQTDEIKMAGYGNIEKRPYGSVSVISIADALISAKTFAPISSFSSRQLSCVMEAINFSLSFTISPISSLTGPCSIDMMMAPS